MAAVKIIKFLGEAPKISPELLPDSAGQVAINAKLFSGDLIPYRAPVIVDGVGRTGEIKTIHALRDPDTGALRWLSFLTDVDIVIGSSTEDQEQRFYYSGDGVPKVSNYALATTGGLPYPVDYYELGLPLPKTEVVGTAATAPSATTSSYARDTGDTATIVTGSPHGLRSGNKASVTGFTGDPASSFNANSVEVTVINSTTFTYFSPGDEVASTGSTAGKVTLSGNTIPRSYVFTWYTPWEEESIASEPSDNTYIKDGQTVTVSGIPTAPPSGKNFIRGVRLYRSVASSSDTAFYRLSTLWFPTAITRASRSGGVSRITVPLHHNLAEGDRFKLTCSDTSFNITGGIVSNVISDTVFEYSQAGSNVTDVAVTGTLYHDVAELPTDTARYWGDSSYDFVDDFDSSNLFGILGTDDYDPPPQNLQGMIAIQNSMFCGFVNNKIYFSEPGKPHAWPEKYSLTIEYDIIGISAVQGLVLVMTTDYPYLLNGSNPATLGIYRIDTLYPCLSKRSIVNMGYGVAYATHGGVAIYAPGTAGGMDLVTKLVHDWDTWDSSLDPSTIVAKFYNGKYYASHSSGAFIFERDEKIGGFFVQTQYQYSAAWTDNVRNEFFFIADNRGNLAQWDRPGQPLSPLEWKSKVIVTKDYMNLGAARVIADYDAPDDEIDAINAFNETIPPFNQNVWNNAPQLGTMNGPGTFVDSTGTTTLPAGGFNEMMVNGDFGTKYKLPLPTALPVTFRIWANKELIFQGILYTSDIFRLPSGYRSDTFEVAVSGSARIRAIHIGETPFGLRAA
jgi:hypothetical protein